MSKTYKPFAACSPSLQNQTYIYQIVPTISNGLAALTSADELLIVDRSSLSTSQVLHLPDVPQRVSCLTAGDEDGNLLLVSGADGNVASYDVRSQKKAASFKIDRGVTALTCRGEQIGVGTELAHHQAIVSTWDRRQHRQTWQSTENNDDITALDFHPTKANVLLSGGDDGQVSIFDTNIAEEDDSLLQGVNHGPIHKAGFLGPDRFYALSSDQNLAIHPISTPGDEEDPLPTLIGDLRPLVPCEYVIELFRSGEGFALAAGSNISDARVDVVELRHATNLGRTPKLSSKSRHMLEGAHGEEVVRSIFADGETGVIFTAGEDGQIKAFQPIDTMESMNVAPKTSKGKKGSETRFKPY